MEGRAPSRPSLGPWFGSCACGHDGAWPSIRRGGHKGPGPSIGFFPWRDALRRVCLWGRGSVRVLAAMTEHGPPSEEAAIRGRGPSSGFSHGGTRSVASVLGSWFGSCCVRFGTGRACGHDRAWPSIRRGGHEGPWPFSEVTCRPLHPRSRHLTPGSLLVIIAWRLLGAPDFRSHLRPWA